MRRVIALTVAAAAVGLIATHVRAQERSQPAVDRGVAFLKSQATQIKSAGEAGIAALALSRARVSVEDPAFRAIVSGFSSSFGEHGYVPESKGGPDHYEAAVVLMALDSMDRIGYKPQIEMVAQFLLSHQLPNGAWDYSDRVFGDTSMSQYALLALFEAENDGVTIPPNVWDRAASWYLSVQNASGSWNYRRDQGTPETLSMTGAGIGSLLICEKQLARHRKGQDFANTLMTPLNVDGQPFESRYKVNTSAASIRSAVAKGLSWLTKNFELSGNEIVGETPFYCLYGIERVAALDATKTLESIRWYDRGLEYLLRTQMSAGSWKAKYDEIPNTCWGILFSTKSTEQRMKAIQIHRLPAGQQRPGRFLPADLSNAEIIGQTIVSRPMNGAIEGMLKVLEDSSNDQFEAALQGLLERYQTEGPKVLRPFKDHFRHQLTSGDPSARVLAAWALARIGDIDVAPLLIRALLDQDDDVVAASQLGLQILSRKLQGFGQASKTWTPEQKREAAKQWLAWYNAIKPPDLDAPDDILSVMAIPTSRESAIPSPIQPKQP